MTSAFSDDQSEFTEEEYMKYREDKIMEIRQDIIKF
jgi:hypothetical protein